MSDEDWAAEAEALIAEVERLRGELKAAAEVLRQAADALRPHRSTAVGPGHDVVVAARRADAAAEGGRLDPTEAEVEAGAQALLSKYRGQRTAELIQRQARTARKHSRAVLVARLDALSSGTKEKDE